MSYVSLMEIVLIESKVGKTPNKQTGQLPQWKVARAILRKEDGSVSTLGQFRIPRDHEETVGLGLYQVGFSLGVLDFGDNAGEIRPQFVSFTPVDAKAVFGRAAPAPVATPSKAAA